MQVLTHLRHAFPFVVCVTWFVLATALLVSFLEFAAANKLIKSTPVVGNQLIATFATFFLVFKIQHVFLYRKLRQIMLKRMHATGETLI